MHRPRLPARPGDARPRRGQCRLGGWPAGAGFAGQRDPGHRHRRHGGGALQRRAAGQGQRGTDRRGDDRLLRRRCRQPDPRRAFRPARGVSGHGLRAAGKPVLRARPGAWRPPRTPPGTGRQGQPAALPASAAGAFAAGAGTAVGDDRGIRLRPVQAVPQRCRLGLAGHRPAGHERWPGHGIPRLRRRRLAGQADRPVARFRPWRGARRLFGAALVSAGRSLVGTERRIGVDLRADRLAGYRHHLGGDPHRGDALRRPGRPGRHRCHRGAEHPRPR